MRTVGTTIDRVDGVKKVTGQAKYVDDIRMSRMLYAQVKRSPYAHAKILSIDTSEAEKLPGVKSVITGDYYKKRGGLYLEDKNFLAVGTAKYRGEAVAAVAAETLDIAKAAVELIKVEYEELPAVTNPIEGMKPDAPLIHPDLGTYKVAPIFHPVPGTNISHHYKLRKGDVDRGFAEADYVAEHTFYVPHVQHVPIEPHVAVAQYEADGKLTVWASCQSPFAVRQALATSFDIPLNKVRVISPYVGGGFGSKAGTTLEGIVIPLSMLNCGRPVKMTYTREEEFEDAYVRQGVYATLKTGVRKSDGKILAQKIEYVWDGGAYTEYGVNIVKAAGIACPGPYDIDNIWCDSYCVYTNHPVGGPYRGFGMCEIHFAIEQNLDMIAHEIGMSEVDIRRVNGLRAGGATATGQILEDCGYQDCLETVVKELEYDKPCEQVAPNLIRAKGIAGGWKSPSQPTDVASAAIIRMNEDGTFMLMTSGQDIGQGSDTVLTQIAAEVLDIDPSKITIRTGDTDHTPYEWQTVASRTTYCAGNAVKLAAEDAKNEILELAQIKFGCSKRDLELKDGYVVHKIHKDKKVPLSTFALGLTLPDASGIHGPLIGKGSFVVPNNVGYDQETGQSPKPVAFWTVGVNGAEVEVNTDTGEIRVLKMISCFDPGKVINPALYEAQVEGAMVQALGTAIFEELMLKDGRILNRNFVDYKIPTADDMPELTVRVAEHEEPTGPYGARGIGEPVMVPGAPAIANAVANAIGCRFFRMPIRADDVLKALKEKKAQEA